MPGIFRMHSTAVVTSRSWLMNSHFTFMKELDDLILVLEDFRPALSAVEVAGHRIKEALQKGGKLLSCGNGGSAADALHLAEELVGRFEADRISLPAICLSADPTLLTCIANDFGYDRVFSRQVEGLGRPGDVLVVFSSSGNSNNIVAALQTAKATGLLTIALLGKGGGRCLGQADFEIVVPGGNTARIQEVHTLILHSWLKLIESTDWRRS
jgi:phosphoheptose isomerase